MIRAVKDSTFGGLAPLTLPSLCKKKNSAFSLARLSGSARAWPCGLCHTASAV
jgi:hypothetical protein